MGALHVAHRLEAFAEQGLDAQIAFPPQTDETPGRILAAGGLIRRAVPYETLADNTFAESASEAPGA